MKRLAVAILVVLLASVSAVAGGKKHYEWEYAPNTGKTDTTYSNVFAVGDWDHYEVAIYEVVNNDSMATDSVMFNLQTKADDADDSWRQVYSTGLLEDSSASFPLRKYFPIDSSIVYTLDDLIRWQYVWNRPAGDSLTDTYEVELHMDIFRR